MAASTDFGERSPDECSESSQRVLCARVFHGGGAHQQVARNGGASDQGLQNGAEKVPRGATGYVGPFGIAELAGQK
jgi:hypothetical protein